jgi:hypothetical protein
MIFFISNSSLCNCDRNYLPKAFQNYRKYRIRLQNLGKDNFDEFQDFVIKKRQMGFQFEYRYVSDVDSIRGLDRIRGLYIGTYKKRTDLSQIQEFIHIIKSQHNFYENNA